MVGVAGERVRPVDVRSLDGAVDVDLAGAARQRLHEERVEVVARLRGGELQEPVERVERQPAQNHVSVRQ